MANTGSAGASSADELGYISDDDLLDGITEDLFSDADAVNDFFSGVDEIKEADEGEGDAAVGKAAAAAGGEDGGIFLSLGRGFQRKASVNFEGFGFDGEPDAGATDAFQEVEGGVSGRKASLESESYGGFEGLAE